MVLRCRSSTIFALFFSISCSSPARKNDTRFTFSYAFKVPPIIHHLHKHKPNKLFLSRANKVINKVQSEVILPNDVYIRKAKPKDVLAASKLLTDVFFPSPFFGISPLEWLKTYFSVQDGLIEASDNYVTFVACKKKNDQVIAICEIDGRIRKSQTKRLTMDQGNTSTTDPIGWKSEIKYVPYVCNLAVNPKDRNRGIGKALIATCENKAKDWQSSNIYLRVRRMNTIAIDVYTRLGYEMMKDDLECLDSVLDENDVVWLTKAL